MRRGTGVALVGLLALAGCGSGSGAAKGVPSNVCGAIERLDPSGLLGGAAAKHRACEADDPSGSLGVAVWTAASGKRVSVSVIDGGKGTAAEFDQLYGQASDRQRCTASGRRCLDKTSTGQAETGTFIVDEGATYLVVWMSDENGRSAGIDITPAQRPAFVAFVADATNEIYGSAVHLPAAAAPSSAAPSSAAATGGTLADQLTALGYQRTMTGHYYANELGREVAIEDWEPVSDPSLPHVNTSEARPGGPGKPAVSQASYTSGAGGYARFWCVPSAQSAFDPGRVIDQTKIAKQLLESGRARLVPGQNDTKTMTSADGSVTCYMK